MNDFYRMGFFVFVNKTSLLHEDRLIVFCVTLVVYRTRMSLNGRLEVLYICVSVFWLSGCHQTEQTEHTYMQLNMSDLISIGLDC